MHKIERSRILFISLWVPGRGRSGGCWDTSVCRWRGSCPWSWGHAPAATCSSASPDRQFKLGVSSSLLGKAVRFSQLRSSVPDPWQFLLPIRILGSVPPTNGSGSCSFCHWPSKFFRFTIWRYSSPIKSHKKSQNNRNLGFSYYFWFMIWKFGSVPLTNKIRNRKAQKLRILRIGIRI